MGISRAEVNLRRLLAAASQQGNQTKLRHYVASMREQLAILTGESSHDDLPLIPASEAEVYAKSIDELAGRIDSSASPLDIWESLRVKEDDDKSSRSGVSVQRSELGLVEEEPEPILGPQTLSPTLRRRRFQRDQQQGSAAGRDQKQGGSIRLDAATTQMVDKHRKIQDALIDEMSIFSEQMKNNSLMMEQSLKDTERVLDRTEEAVEHSLAATNHANFRAGFIYKSTWKTGCFTWLMLFLMCLIFIFMIGVIRVTG